MKIRNLRMDASEGILFERQLEFVAAQTYDYRMRELVARTLVPKYNAISQNAATFTWRSYSKVGVAKLIAAYSDDLPRADVQGEENTSILKDVGASYGYNIREMRQAQEAGYQLPAMKAEAARQAIEEKINSILLFGDTAHGLYGLLNQPNATLYTIPNGADASPNWEDKTGREIMADMLGIQTNQVTLTSGAEKPDTILLPLVSYNLIATEPYSDNSDATVLETFLRISPYVKKVIPVHGLETAGAGATRRMVSYRMAADAVGALIPQEFEQLDPEQHNLEFVVDCLARTGGVVAFYPLSISYGDDI